MGRIFCLQRKGAGYLLKTQITHCQKTVVKEGRASQSLFVVGEQPKICIEGLDSLCYHNQHRNRTDQKSKTLRTDHLRI